MIYIKTQIYGVTLPLYPDLKITHSKNSIEISTVTRHIDKAGRWYKQIVYKQYDYDGNIHSYLDVFKVFSKDIYDILIMTMVDVKTLQTIDEATEEPVFVLDDNQVSEVKRLHDIHYYALKEREY